MSEEIELEEIRKIVGKKMPKTTAALVALHNLGAVDEKHAVTQEEWGKEYDRLRKKTEGGR